MSKNKIKVKTTFFSDFKAFISRGNVLDMDVGVIIANAFGKITTSLVNDVVMPLIGLLIGDIDLSKWNIVVREAQLAADGSVLKEAVTVGIGTLLTVIIDFLLVALVVFILIRNLGRAKVRLSKKEEEKPAEPAPEPEPSKEELLLAEIRDLLKEKK